MWLSWEQPLWSPAPTCWGHFARVRLQESEALKPLPRVGLRALSFWRVKPSEQGHLWLYSEALPDLKFYLVKEAINIC